MRADLRFVLDHDVDRAVRDVLMRAGHECWTAAEAGLSNASDGELAVYADDHQAALLTHDREFTRWRRRRTFGQHVWLRCAEPDAVDVVQQHLDDLVAVLSQLPEVVVEVRQGHVKVFGPQWE